MRKITLIAAVLMLCISGAAFAQDVDMQAFCGDLSEDDCAILTNAQEAAASLDAAAYDFELNFNISNIPDEDEPVAFSMTGSGAYSGVLALQTLMTDMMTDPDPGAMIVTVLEEFDTDLSLTFNFPEAMQSEGVPATLTLEARLVDGVGYFNFDTLQALINDPSLQGWMGLDLASFLRELMTQMPDLFDEMSGSMTGSMDMMAYADQFADPEFLNSFMSISRTDDGSGDVATFEFVFDFGALMSTPAMMDMMEQQFEAQGMTMTEEEMNQMLAMISQMYKGITLTLTEEIGISDGFVHSVYGAFSFDMSGMMAAMPDANSSEETPNIDMDFSLEYNSFNDIPAITAPEDAQVVPYQALLGMMGGMDSAASGAMAAMATEPLPITPTPTPGS